MNFRTWLGQHSRRVALYSMWAATPGTWTTAEELHTELHRAGVDSRECIHLAAAKDAWLAATDGWEHDCVDCGNDSTDERYMVHDHVWTAAGMCSFGMLCIGCLETRLGRHLQASDFLDVPLNTATTRQRSDRLTCRLVSADPDRGATTTVDVDQL